MLLRFRVAFALFLTAGVVGCARSSNPPGPSRAIDAQLQAAIDSVVRADIIDRGVTGVSVVIVRGGRTLFQRSWGFTDRSRQSPAL